MVNARASGGMLILVRRELELERRAGNAVGLEDANKLKSRLEDGAERMGVEILDTVANLPNNLNAMVEGSALKLRCFSLSLLDDCFTLYLNLSRSNSQCRRLRFNILANFPSMKAYFKFELLRNSSSIIAYAVGLVRTCQDLSTPTCSKNLRRISRQLVLIQW